MTDDHDGMEEFWAGTHTLLVHRSSASFSFLFFLSSHFEMVRTH
jgi:hypothetical protein